MREPRRSVDEARIQTCCGDRQPEGHSTSAVLVSQSSVAATIPSALPAKARPVSLRRKPHGTEGMVEENHDWLPYLCDDKGKHCVGRDPLTIPTEILTLAGHPRRRTRDLIAAFNNATGGENLGRERVSGYRAIRSWCLACLDGNAAEVRRCSTINCPFWAFRLGKNPHNPKRGRDPFADGGST